MKILLISVGTRGDVEPFLAIAGLLKEKGHEVVCCFPEQFRKLTIDSNYHFVGLSEEFLKILDSKDGKIVMGGKASVLRKIKAYYQLYRKSTIINRILVKEQQSLVKYFNPDKIIYTTLLFLLSCILDIYA